MADASYDAVIIGGGNKALILGMYLARYGGMSVGIFEKRHEAGGGWTTEEGPAPGFLGDYHATEVAALYHLTTARDFPEWRELGGEQATPKAAVGGVFKEDGSSVVIYSRSTDPTGEMSAKSIARLSKRDAETWVKLREPYEKIWAPYYIEYVLNPPPAEGPDAMDRLIADPRAGIDPSWMIKSPLEALRDLFESDALISMLLRNMQSAANARPSEGGMGLHVLFHALGAPALRWVIGGTHNFAHAAVKIFLADGGKIFTQHTVDRVIIEDGKAKGIILADGSRVEAKKFVVSTLDPYSLCFKLIGKEHLDWRLLRRVEHLQKWDTCITWYTGALHDQPQYRAAKDNPDLKETWHISLVSKDPEELDRCWSKRRIGLMPGQEDLQLCMFSYYSDRNRAPEGKCTIMTEQFILPGNSLSEKEWLAYKKRHAEEVIKEWGKFAPNMTWDNVIGYVPLTPYDHSRLANMAPEGNWAVIDAGIPSQYGRYRPVPELARYKAPIKDLYCTGSAWHPYGGGFNWQGYNCYKIIADDFGLRKPWEECGSRW